MNASLTDSELLAAYEPVLRFTQGELFLPTAVASYVEQASLWRFDRTPGAECVVPAGELDLDRLATEAARHPGADLSLRYVTAPLSRRQYRQWTKRPDRPPFRSGGRFTRVGLLGRLVDALFRAGLLLRGRVPGGVAAAAEIAYRRDAETGRHPYYGRVTRDGGYLALQYWFFYVMNDWRSSFGGANDHEADWEQVTVFVAEPQEGERRPTWIAVSSHDLHGDDLRRRWDDPELLWEGGHPVVFVAAGSHSGAVVAGDYVTSVDPPRALRTVLGPIGAAVRLLAPWARGYIARGLGIPFVDYARGDGVTIGPGQDRTWSPVVIDDTTPWVRQYRGLWGLDTRDRFGGERAPAGPRYERGGAVRTSWSDPVGWAGLQKVPASLGEARALLAARQDEIDVELGALDDDIACRRRRLRTLAAEEWSLRPRRDLGPLAASRAAALRSGEAELRTLVARRSELATERAAHDDTLAAPPVAPAAQAHLRHRAVPGPGSPGTSKAADTRERERFLRAWSILSTPLLFVAVALLLLDSEVAVVTGVGLFVAVFLAVEALARGHFLAYVATVVGLVAAVLLAVALVQGVLGRWQLVLAVVAGVAAVGTLFVNLRELRRG